MNEPAALQPLDESNLRLAALVRPADWQNPEPAGRYNLVVIGGGTAGLVAAAGAAQLGAKVALIERELLGGDCLNVGCVPSKALLSAASAAAAVRGASEFGVRAGEVQVDFPAVMARMRRLRAGIAPHDSATRFRDLGVDVFFGDAQFAAVDAVHVGGAVLSFRKAVICTGSRPTLPAIPGLDEIQPLTNETVFSLTDLPGRLAVVGAGPIGCELAQAFARFGSRVWLIESEHGVLPREDRECAALLEAALQRDGVEVACCARMLRCERMAGGGVRLNVETHSGQVVTEVDQVLVAAGRTANVQALELAAAGIRLDPRGRLIVNDRLQTTNPRVYAAGDVVDSYRFTHAADFMARVVIQNALFLGRRRLSRLVIPWCTYTSPELAHIGLTAEQARQQGIGIDTFSLPLHRVDRAVLDGSGTGLVRIHVRRGTDAIVGGTIVAPHAGEMIGELSLAMTHRLGLQRIAAAIHPYPTHTEALRKVGDLHAQTRLTPLVRRLLQAWLRWSR